jgi:hypothetical protein
MKDNENKSFTEGDGTQYLAEIPFKSVIKSCEPEIPHSG